MQLTENMRVWTEQHPNQRAETDFQMFPGRIDHASCAVFRVGTLREWSTVKLLLAAVMKPQPSECLLATLPKDIIKRHH